MLAETGRTRHVDLSSELRAGSEAYGTPRRKTTVREEMSRRNHPTSFVVRSGSNGTDASTVPPPEHLSGPGRTARLTSAEAGEIVDARAGSVGFEP
jgi:hypothetical protein